MTDDGVEPQAGEGPRPVPDGPEGDTDTAGRTTPANETDWDELGGARRGRAIGWFWILFWLIFLVPTIVDYSRGDQRQQLGAVILTAGAVVYALTMRTAIRAMRGGGQGRTLRDHSTRVAVAGSALVLVLLAGAVAMVGSKGYGLLPYSAVLLAMGVAMPFGLVAAITLCVVVSVGSWLTGSGFDSGLFFSSIASAVASGFGAYSISRSFAARRARQDASILRVQEERNRMARDLHDILGHSLTVITMKAELAGRLVDIDPAKAKLQIEELEQLSRSALADVRRTVSGYREISLAGELARARSALADAGIRADLPGSVDDVSPDLRELFAWVVRESTTNIIRHSRAKSASIVVQPTRISVHDDGHGASAGHGNGLKGLAERATAAGATLTTSSDHGFTVEVAVPTAGRAS